MDVNKTIREYIANVYHMSLATSSDNKPWVCEVHFAVDDELTIYWRSKQDRRHSLEIAANPYVAGNIVEQHALDVKPRGVYFEGVAELLDDVTEEHPAFKALHARSGLRLDALEEAKTAEGHKFYKITVADWYLFDARESSPSKKYRLEQ